MITLNGNKYEVPSTYKIVMDDAANSQTIKTAVIAANREDYYAEAYGNGKCVDVTKVVAAALGEKVKITLIDDKDGIVAETDTGVTVTVAQAVLKTTKKKKNKPSDDVEATAVESNN